MSSDYFFCANCEEKCHEDELHMAFDETYCESCYDDLFRHCDICDRLVAESNTFYCEDDDSGCYCESCYNNEVRSDEGAPSNPMVTIKDVEEVIDLAHKWMKNRIKVRRKISIQANHFLLEKIQNKVGKVSKPINLFGLGSMITYDLSVSKDLKAAVEEFAMINGLEWCLIETEGYRRLGLSQNLRSTNLPSIVKLIKYLTISHRRNSKVA